jgi:hypothetical protein
VHFLRGQNHGKLLSSLRTNGVEDDPVSAERLLVEELDPAKIDRNGAPGCFPLIYEMKEEIPVRKKMVKGSSAASFAGS